MITLKKVSSGSLSRDKVFEIYLNAFPQEERRELSSIDRLLESEKCYHLHAIYDDSSVVGMTAYWELGEIVFVEYLAMDANLRGRGLGSKALNKIIERIGQRKVIFEVEPPTNEIAIRRIDFYRRYGFKLWDNISYKQPPYRTSDDWLPMLLMTNGGKPNQKDIELLYQKVYNVSLDH